MSISVDVCLMSGKKVSLEVEAERSLGLVKDQKFGTRDPRVGKVLRARVEEHMGSFGNAESTLLSKFYGILNWRHSRLQLRLL